MTSGKFSRAVFVLTIASLVSILDRLAKYIVSVNLSQAQSVKVLPNIFHITLVLNKGMAFGLLKEQRIFFLAISLAIISFIVFYIWQTRSVYSHLALGLILGGAIGNLIDRIRFGYVIDFLDFRIWPVFNIADSSITIGTILLVLGHLKAKGKSKKVKVQGKS